MHTCQQPTRGPLCQHWMVANQFKTGDEMKNINDMKMGEWDKKVKSVSGMIMGKREDPRKIKKDPALILHSAGT